MVGCSRRRWWDGPFGGPERRASSTNAQVLTTMASASSWLSCTQWRERACGRSGTMGACIQARWRRRRTRRRPRTRGRAAHHDIHPLAEQVAQNHLACGRRRRRGRHVRRHRGTAAAEPRDGAIGRGQARKCSARGLPAGTMGRARAVDHVFRAPQAHHAHALPARLRLRLRRQLTAAAAGPIRCVLRSGGGDAPRQWQLIAVGVVTPVAHPIRSLTPGAAGVVVSAWPVVTIAAGIRCGAIPPCLACREAKTFWP